MKATMFTMAVLLASYGMAQDRAALSLSVKNFKHDTGKLMVALYNDPADYLKEPFRVADTVIYDLQQVTILFADLPKGTYAISIYHDENENGDLDTNFMGIPEEPYAFSNDAPGRFGPPSFEAAAFDLTEIQNTHMINLP